MSKCKQCGTNISFMSVLNTINPFKVKCSNCKAPIYLDKKSAGIALLIIFPIMLFFIHSYYGTADFWVKVMLPVVAIAEVSYFLLIKKGIVKLHHKPLNQD